MEIEITEEAESQLKEFDSNHEREILKAIEDVAENGFGQETNTKIIRDDELGEIWRLKVKEGGRGGLDYRIFLDYKKGALIVLSVMHRDNAYEE